MTAPVTVTAADRESANVLWEATDGLWNVTHEQVAQLVANTRQQAEAASKAREAELLLEFGQAFEAIKATTADGTTPNKFAKAALTSIDAARAKASSDGGEG